MGRPMAERLIAAGHRLFLFNRTRDKALPLQEQGAVVADCARDAAGQAECVILMLSDYQAVCDTLFVQENLDFSGKTVIQMGTILPGQSLALKERIESGCGSYFEAPVLGSRDKAAAGQLIIMVGSTRRQFDCFRSLLENFGPDPKYIGHTGKAAALKLALNQLIISLISTFSLALGMVERSDVRTEDFMAVLRESALFAPTFDKKLPRISGRNFENPNFPVRHMLKDVRLILEQAASLGLDTGLLREVERILRQAVDQGLGAQDYSAVSKVIIPDGTR